MGDALKLNFNDVKHNAHSSDFLILFLLVPLIAACRWFIEQFVATYFFTTSIQARTLLAKGQRLQYRTTKKKFQESFWKFVFYASMCVVGFLTVKDPTDTLLLSSYPNDLPASMKTYYMIELAFYIWMTVCLQSDTRRKDHKEMTFHHMATMVLLMVSYSNGVTNIGGLILLIHDLSDPFLEFAKMMSYTKKELYATLAFVCFALTFLSTRLIWYPYSALYPSYIHGYELCIIYDKLPYYYLVVGCLLGILACNVMWSCLILKMIFRKLTTDGQVKDCRSDDDEDND